MEKVKSEQETKAKLPRYLRMMVFNFIDLKETVYTLACIS